METVIPYIKPKVIPLKKQPFTPQIKTPLRINKPSLIPKPKA